jgi:hypothetical protein
MECATRLDEIVECLNDGGISTYRVPNENFVLVERGRWDRSVSGKGLQNAGSQWSIALQEHQTDLITVRKEPVAAGMRNFFH